jgi:hypothetical protein
MSHNLIEITLQTLNQFSNKQNILVDLFVVFM